MFRIACGLRERGGWEMAPSEFWRMSPAEWWLLFEVNIGREMQEKRETMDRIKRRYFQSKAEAE